jgi:hypothetical protein
MKPKNFPAKKYVRQQGALARLKGAYAATREGLAESLALINAIRGGEEKARGVRTKKDRSKGAVMFR